MSLHICIWRLLNGFHNAFLDRFMKLHSVLGVKNAIVNVARSQTSEISVLLRRWVFILKRKMTSSVWYGDAMTATTATTTTCLCFSLHFFSYIVLCFAANDEDNRESAFHYSTNLFVLCWFCLIFANLCSFSLSPSIRYFFSPHYCCFLRTSSLCEAQYTEQQDLLQCRPRTKTSLKWISEENTT